MSDKLIDPQLTPPEIEQVTEINFLAERLARKYSETVHFYVTQEKLSIGEAEQKLASTTEASLQRILERPPRDVEWWALQHLAGHDPKVALAKWEEIKQAARDDLASGHHFVNEVVLGTPYERGVFLAVRHAFKEQWKPQNAGEQLMVDMLSQLFCEHLFWLRSLQTRANLDAENEKVDVTRTGAWKPSRISDYEAIEQSAEMVDRFNRLFLRTLRALRDLRRWAVNVNITNPGQVNIAQQQVNAAKIEPAGVAEED